MHPDFLKKPENELTLPASDEIQTGRLCGICNRLSGTLLIRNVETECAVYDVYYCPACETGSVVPMPREEDLSALYTSGRYRSAEGKRFNPVIEFFIYLSTGIVRSQAYRGSNCCQLSVTESASLHVDRRTGIQGHALNALSIALGE